MNKYNPKRICLSNLTFIKLCFSQASLIWIRTYVLIYVPCCQGILTMAIRVVEFSNGGTILERFLPQNQHTQRKLLKFENWVNGEVLKSAKLWLSKSIFYVKNYQIFFSLNNTNLGAHFLLLTFFHNINF